MKFLILRVVDRDRLPRRSARSSFRRTISAIALAASSRASSSCSAATVMSTSTALRASGLAARVHRLGRDVPAQLATAHARPSPPPPGSSPPTSRSSLIASGFVRYVRRPGSRRAERLPGRDPRGRLVQAAAAHRVERADDDARRRPRGDDPPLAADPVPHAAEVDLALGVEVRRRGIAGRPTFRLRAHSAATLAAAHSHWARRPSSSETFGSHPSSVRMRVVSAFVRRWSPGTGGCRVRSSVRPEIRSSRRDRLVHRGLERAADVVGALPALHRRDRRVDDVARRTSSRGSGRRRRRARSRCRSRARRRCA